jgi:RNA polymerase sigma-70 factor (ECF subfamily)
MVHGVLLARVPRADVDDLSQDVFLLALRRLPTLREPASFGAWLATIARNLATDFHRRLVPHDQWTTETADSVVDKNSEKNSEKDHDGQAIEILETIKRLPDAYRETLILRLVEGMTGPEIAARTGMTPGSVRVNLHRGMQQLRAKLNLNTGSRATEEETS